MLRGRQAEFNRLAQLLEQPPRAIHLITGPPGSGKSALLKALVKYAQKTGYITVKIQTEWFTDRHTPNEEIRKVTLGEQLAATQTETTHTRSGTAGVSGGVNSIGHAEAEATQQQSQTDQPQTKGNPILQQQLDRIIRQLREHHPQVRGILLHCDEFQNLCENAKKDSPNYEPTRQHLETLNEGIHDADTSLPIITVLAGIPPAENTFTTFLMRKSSANIVELLPVDGYPITDPTSTYCARIIQDYIDHGQTIDGHQLSIHPETLYQWALQCDGHVVHANHTGAIIQTQLRDWHQQGKTTVTPDDCRTIHTSIQLRRMEYYRERCNMDQDDNATENVKRAAETLLPHLTIAIVHQRNENDPTTPPTFLTWATIKHLSEKILADTALADSALKLLIHTGAIRKMGLGTRFARYSYDENTIHHDYIDTAIPTMTKHILDTLSLEEKQQIHATNQNAIANYKGFTTTQWQWQQHAPNIYLTESYHFTYETAREPHVFTPDQAVAIQDKALTNLRNLYRPDLPAHSNKHTEGWLDIIHHAAPEPEEHEKAPSQQKDQ